jgi:hypothetical protein
VKPAAPRCASCPNLTVPEGAEARLRPFEFPELRDAGFELFFCTQCAHAFSRPQVRVRLLELLRTATQPPA